MRDSDVALNKYKELPWVLVIISYDKIIRYDNMYLVDVLSKYVNTIVYLVDFGSFNVKVHNYAGRLYNKVSNRKYVSRVMFKILRSVVNRKVSLERVVKNPNLIDLIFVVDPVRVNFDFKPFKNAVRAYWSQDCIHGGDYYAQVFSDVLDYDVVFCAHKPYMYRFPSGKTYWLPFACNPKFHRRINLPFVYDLVFVGNVPSQRSKYGYKRRELLMYLGERLSNYKVFVGNAYQHDMVWLYNKSKVVLNVSRVGELNWRVFEVLGCGRLLLTDRNAEVGELFNDKEHLVMYSSKDELVELAKYYIEHDYEREKIAERGYMECHKNHTLDHRVKTVLERTIGFKIEVN
jgi:hypothetical protein